MTQDTSLTAHRGFAGVYPENTEPAIRASASGGPDTAHQHTDMIEVDAVLTVDGTLVAFHDDLAERDGDGCGLTDTVIGAMVLGIKETVPTLKTVIDAITQSVAVNLEYKNPSSEDLYAAQSLSPATRTER